MDGLAEVTTEPAFPDLLNLTNKRDGSESSELITAMV